MRVMKFGVRCPAWIEDVGRIPIRNKRGNDCEQRNQRDNPRATSQILHTNILLLFYQGKRQN
jgi:hypothetical protein